MRAGYIVRTRADEGTMNVRKNDTGRRDKALASGANSSAQIIPKRARTGPAIGFACPATWPPARIPYRLRQDGRTRTWRSDL